jgi:hypothetical protein
MMKRLICFIVLIFLFGCGGGGGESSTSAPVPPPPPPPVTIRPDGIGLFSGTFHRDVTNSNMFVRGFISDNDIALTGTIPGSYTPLATGTGTRNGSELSGSVLFSPYGPVFAVGDTAGDVSFSIAPASTTSIVGTYSGLGDSGTIELTPVAISPNYTITYLNLAGTWKSTYWTLNISTSGEIAGAWETSLETIAITGNIVLYPSSNQPFVGVNLTVSSPQPRSLPPVIYPTQGMAYVTDYTGTDSGSTTKNKMELIVLGKNADRFNQRTFGDHVILIKQ